MPNYLICAKRGRWIVRDFDHETAVAHSEGTNPEDYETHRHHWAELSLDLPRDEEAIAKAKWLVQSLAENSGEVLAALSRLHLELDNLLWDMRDGCDRELVYHAIQRVLRAGTQTLAKTYGVDEDYFCGAPDEVP